MHNPAQPSTDHQPPLPGELHEPGPPPAPRPCRWVPQQPCDCATFCHRAAADHPIEAVR